MRGIGYPLAVIEQPGRVDNVFLERGDFDRNSYPSAATVKVYAPGGAVIATKAAGPTSLTITEGVNLDNYYR